MQSTFYEDGFRDGYAAVMSDEDRKPTPPANEAHAAEYAAGWEDGLSEGRSDYWAERQEQSHYDWAAGL